MDRNLNYFPEKPKLFFHPSMCTSNIIQNEKRSRNISITPTLVAGDSTLRQHIVMKSLKHRVCYSERFEIAKQVEPQRIRPQIQAGAHY